MSAKTLTNTIEEKIKGRAEYRARNESDAFYVGCILDASIIRFGVRLSITGIFQKRL